MRRAVALSSKAARLSQGISWQCCSLLTASNGRLPRGTNSCATSLWRHKDQCRQQYTCRASHVKEAAYRIGLMAFFIRCPAELEQAVSPALPETPWPRFQSCARLPSAAHRRAVPVRFPASIDLAGRTTKAAPSKHGGSVSGAERLLDARDRRPGSFMFGPMVPGIG